MIWVTDADGYLIYVSPEWEVLTGQSILDARGLGWLKKVHASDRPIVLNLLSAASNARQSYVLEYRLSHVSGDFGWVSSAAAPSVLPDDGKLLGYLGSVKTIVMDHDVGLASGHVGNLRTPAGILKSVQPTALETMADQLMATHNTAKAAGEKTLLTVLELALIEVGRRLVQEQDDRGLHYR